MDKYTVWFVTGSQHLYGEETLRQVAEDSKAIAAFFENEAGLPCSIRYMPVLKTPDEITMLCEQANTDRECAGIITWMHTFSPAKMWIKGLGSLRKPLLHLHTQFNRDIPWDTIDMDFMNLNQSAHGDREYGYIGARMELSRKVIAGYWKDPEVIRSLNTWMRACCGMAESRLLKIARFGDNMREVAVTEGDKVEAQIRFGWAVNGYGVGDLVKYIDAVSDEDIKRLMDEYRETYDFGKSKNKAQTEAIEVQARIELGIRRFLDEGGFGGFTTTFENLHGMKQLPGLAVQRLMAAGYGFGGEGDWKTAAMVRILKVMGTGLDKGASFMEDYTYHLEPGNEMVLGAHMLEICPSLSADKPRMEVHPLGIGGKEDPARLVFEGKPGEALNASLIDMGNRFRLILNIVDAISVKEKTPKLPVAKVLWKPRPGLSQAAAMWIMAGGAHHTAFSYDVSRECMTDWAEMAGIECVTIDKETDKDRFRNELRLGSIYWGKR